MTIRKGCLFAILWGLLWAAFWPGNTAYGASSAVGTWDFTVSGAKSGSAYLTFNRDYTIRGFTLVTPTSAGNSNSITAPGIDYAPLSGQICGITAITPISSGNGNSSTTPGIGFAPLRGQWGMDGAHVVGFLYNTPSTDTNRLDITSFSGTVSNNQQSFAISGITLDGNVKLSGARPISNSAHLTGNWTIKKSVKGKLIFDEVFVALPDLTMGNGTLYDLTGCGADLCVFGYGVLSKGNRLNVTIKEFPMPADGSACSTLSYSSDGGTISAAAGVINLGSGRATLSGVQSGSPQVKVSMPVICQ